MKKVWGKLYIGAIAGTLMGMVGLHQVAAAPIDTLVKVEGEHTQFVVQFNEKVQPQIKLTLIHLVKKGESVWSIADKYGVRVNELLKLNSLNSQNTLLVNQRVIVPVKPSPTVPSAGQKQVQLYLFVNEQEISTVKKTNEPKQVLSHLVQDGETMFSIARKYKVTTDELMKENGLTEKSYILIGQTLRIPQISYHTVKRGETLSQISRAYNRSVQQLLEVNSMKLNEPIVPGQQLKIVR